MAGNARRILTKTSIFDKGFWASNESGILLVLLTMSILLGIVRPQFVSSYNLAMVVRQFSFVTIVALGQTLVLLSGGIDLSVGSVAGLCGILSAWLMVNTGIDPYVTIVVGVFAGSLCGLINGLLITKVKLNPFIVTLATGEIFGGLIMVITKGWAIMSLPEKVFFLGQGMVGPVPVPVIIMALLAVFFTYILRNTPFGRHIYAIGGNEAASRLVGIQVDKVKTLVYVISGTLSAFAGIILVCRLTSGQPTIGQNWVMPSVTAAIIGGTSLSGGEGTVVGTVIGAALMGVLANAIVLLNVSAYWERVITGVVVLLAVALDRLRASRRTK